MQHKLTAALLATLVLALFAGRADAQFENRADYLGANVGLSGVGSAFTLGLDYEHGITNIGDVGPGIIGIGGLLDYFSYSYGYNYIDFPYSGTLTYFDIGVSGMYHFVLDNRKWDPFLGLVLGYESVSWSAPGGAPYASPYSSGLLLGGSAGVRYFFNDHWAAQARLGFGFYTLAVGVDYKF